MWHYPATLPAATKPKSIFGHQLRAQLDKQNVSIRELGRRLQAQNPKKWSSAENARRSIAKCITGKGATTENRRACAVALGLDPSHFGSPDEDDEEAELYSSLTDALDALVRYTIKRERERV